MRNMISCTAEKLSLLQPDMLQGVVESLAFRIGNQYASENRVRIASADELSISSSVVSRSGSYDQTILLKDGDLVTQCSCRIEEHPMCRHCVAVLLAYHRGGTKIFVKKTNEKSLAAAKAGPRVKDMKFSEIAAFVEWLQPCMEALNRGDELPDAPRLVGSEAEAWVSTIHKLANSLRESEQVEERLHAEIRQRDDELIRFDKLHRSANEEVRTVRITCEQLEREVAGHRAMLGKLSGVAEQLNRNETMVNSLGADFAKKAEQLDALASSLKEAANALQAANVT